MNNTIVKLPVEKPQSLLLLFLLKKNKGIIGTWFFIYFLLPKMLKMFKNIKN